MGAIYTQSKPCIYIYGCHVYVYSLYLAAIMHSIICIYCFGMLQGVVIYQPAPAASSVCKALVEISLKGLGHSRDYRYYPVCKELVFWKVCGLAIGHIV